MTYNGIETNRKGIIIMKTKEELNALKEEIASLNKRLRELSEEDLKLVTGGTVRLSNLFFGREELNEDNP